MKHILLYIVYSQHITCFHLVVALEIGVRFVEAHADPEGIGLLAGIFDMRQHVGAGIVTDEVVVIAFALVFVQPDDRLAPDQESFVGNTINQINEYGFEAGGPVVRDRLWLWGAFGTNDIRNRTGGEIPADVQNDDLSFFFLFFFVRVAFVVLSLTLVILNTS